MAAQRLSELDAACARACQVTLLLGLCAAALGFNAPASPLQSVRRAAAPPCAATMVSQDRRSVMASLMAGVAAASLASPSLAIVPGLTAPGLVPATKKVASGRPDFSSIRDSTSFWSPKGIMDSVPKVKGIITPKTPVK